MRIDLALISQWIAPGSRVLDLACGDGTLLQYLQTQKAVSGYGIEIDAQHISACLAKNVNVIQTDLDAGLSDFDVDSFDYVVMTQSLQTMHYPARLLNEMLRVGRQGIVSFPNFGHWRSRLSFAFGGRMPVTRSLPYTWYNTPNIHLCTLRDFEDLCKELNIEILQASTSKSQLQHNAALRWLPNLFSEVAMYRFKKQAVISRSK